MKFSRVYLVVFFLILDNLSSCLGAIGDSRLRISINYPGISILSADKSMRPTAVVRLYDPATEVTYHQTNNSHIVEALGTLWNPLYQPERCNSLYASADARRKVPTRICDPDTFMPPSQARELQKISYYVPRVTGCQCDSFQHCNHYESGFTLYIAVVPVLMKPPINLLQNALHNASALLSPRNFLAGHNEDGSSSSVMTNTQDGTSQTITDLEPVNLVIPRDLRGQPIDLISKNADVYEILAHYLRALWVTGECDEDMVICFFPKEKRVSVSIGGRLFDKLTASCMNDLYSDINRAMLEYMVPLTPQASVEQKQAMAALDEDNVESSMSRAASLAKRQQKERLRLTTLFKAFVDNVNKLIQSRSDDPCATVVVTKWSNYEILGFAIAFGVGMSIVLSVFLKFCGLCSDFADRLIEGAPLTLFGLNFCRRRRTMRRIPFSPRLAYTEEEGLGQSQNLSPIRISNFKKPQNNLPNDKSQYEIIRNPAKTTVTAVQCEIGIETPLLERTIPNSPSKQSKKPTAV